MTTPTQPLPGQAEVGADARAEISQFVAAVGRALDDLPPDDAAELTDGLEADLSATWAEEGVTPSQRFGSPQSYAAELRSAAGLPPRPSGRKRAPGLVFTVRAQAAGWRRSLESQPWWPEATQRAEQLQPAWWALRGLALTGLIVVLAHGTLGGLALLLMLPVAIVLVSLSMRQGDAEQAATARARQLLRAWNVVTVALLIGFVLLVNDAGRSSGSDYTYVDGADQPGLTMDGSSVTNVFAYDSDGQPLSRVRLYDQDGKPLTTGPDWRDGASDDSSYAEWQTSPDSAGGPLEWNTYPLLRREMPTASMAWGQLFAPAPPFSVVPALPPSAVTSSATPTPSPSAKAGSKS